VSTEGAYAPDTAAPRADELPRLRRSTQAKLTDPRGTDMADYVEAGGVRTWYDEQGEGEAARPPARRAGRARFFEKNIAP